RWYEWRDYPQQRMERLDPKLLCGRVEVSIVLCIFQVPSERSWPATLISSKSTAYSMDSNTRSCALPRSAVPTFASRPRTIGPVAGRTTKSSVQCEMIVATSFRLQLCYPAV